MEVFVFNAAKPRGSLEEFNERVASFCLDNPISAISAKCIGPSLVLSLTHADDLQMDLGPTLLAKVVSINGLNDLLEEELTNELDTISEEDTDEDPRLAAAIDVVTRTDLPTEGFAIFHIVTGEVESDDE